MQILLKMAKNAILFGLLLIGVSGMPSAQTTGVGAWPSQKPIRLIAVFPPGGSVDQVARILAPALQAELKQNVIVENIGGASGVIGTSAMTRSDPDGYTFAVVFDTHGVNPSLKDKLPYDTIKDIAPVTLIGTSPMVLVASKKSGISSFKQLVDLSKAGKQFSYGSIGIGSLGHLAMARLAKQAGFDWNHIPYRGGGPLMNAILANEIPMEFINQDAALPYVAAGKLRPIAVSSLQRNPLYPNVPTVAESGYPGFQALSWAGISAPKGTPKPVLDKLEAAMIAALQTPEVRQRIESVGFVIPPLGAIAYNNFLKSEIDLWTNLIKKSGIKPE